MACFAMKRCVKDSELCRQLFFGGEKKVGDDGVVVEDYGVSDEDIRRYQGYFARDSKVTMDLSDLGGELPSSATVDGKAPFAADLPPCLVMGAADDMFIDLEALEETSEYFGLENHEVVDSPHDVMLGAKWQNAAKALGKWVAELTL
jgi:acetyl esterase/lipase